MTDLKPLTLGVDILEDIARELRMDGGCAEFELWLDVVSATLVSVERGEPESAAMEADDRYLFVPQACERGAGLRDFARTLDDPELRLDVERAMSGGRGAYRRVKDCLHRNGAIQLWYDFEAAADLELATGWLAQRGFDVSVVSR